MPGPHRLSIDSIEGVVAVSGELDGHSAPQLEAVLADLDAGTELRIDVRGVDFVDSTGLRTLLLAQQRCEDAGGRLVLVGPSSALRRLLELTGLRTRFHLDD
jgi:anti-sigma B factor antagonist